MKGFAYIAALVGFLCAAFLIARNDAALIFSLVASQGAGLVAVVGFHSIPLVFSAGGWWALGRHDWDGSVPAYFKARVLREAVSDLLPLGPITGPIAGARLLILRGARVVPTAAALTVDQTAETLSQFIFALLGLALFARMSDASPVLNGVAQGLFLCGLAVVVFVLAQRGGLIRWAERAMMPLLRPFARADYNPGDVHDAVWRLYGRIRPLVLSFALHLISWCVGAGEVWLVLSLLGQHVTLAQAFVLESLGQAVRSAAFMIPGGLGVQEGGFLVLGTALGLSPSVSLSLSLTKRLREIAIGLPTLLAWQWIEAKKLARGARS